MHLVSTFVSVISGRPYVWSDHFARFVKLDRNEA